VLARLRRSWKWAALLGLVVVVVVVVAVVAMLAVGGGGGEEKASSGGVERAPDTPIVIPAEEPIVVGVSTALTGPIGERGSEYRDAVIVSVNRWKEANGSEIGGHEIQVIAEDDGCTDAEQTGEAARRLLQRHGLVGVIGPQCSSGVAAVTSLYRDAGIVAISGSATATSLTRDQPDDGFFFRTAYRNDLEGILIGSSAGLFNQSRAVVVDNGELYSRDLARNAWQALTANGVSVTRERIEQGVVDFNEIVAKIVESKPAFVGFAGFNPEAALLYRQLRDAGYDGVFGASDGAASQVDFVDPVGEAAEGVLFAGCRFPLPEAMRADLTDLIGMEPSATFSAQYADAATILLDAVNEVAEEGDDGSLTIQPTALRDAVRATNVTDGISGALAFDSKGDRVPSPGEELSDVQEAALATRQQDIFTTLGLIPCQVQDGKLVALGGPGAGEFRLP
jgi:branched-chain amino acid transport system substrate-binding protein